MKRPWRTMEIDYNFFNFRRIWSHWPLVRGILIVTLLTGVWMHYINGTKKMGKLALQYKAEKQKKR